MNNPDQETIQSWLKGELEGSELKAMEQWAEEHSEALESEMGWQEIGGNISQSYAASKEPPYADFFNQRIQNQAADSIDLKTSVDKPSLWSSINWLIAPAALAGMALCFYMGTRIDQQSDTQRVTAHLLKEVYTPAEGIQSEVTFSGGSTVITLEGLEDIPQSLDIASGETSIGSSPMMMAKLERNATYF